MVHKLKRTPEQAAAAAMRQILGRRPDDQSAALVAQAVLNAAREAYDSKAERKHCTAVAKAWLETNPAPTAHEALRDLLLQERAAARVEGPRQHVDVELSNDR